MAGSMRSSLRCSTPTSFEDDRAQSWRGVLKAKLEKLYEDEHKGDLRDSVREYVQESVDEGEEDDE
jgi:hypothetical protein